jgi:hypothetical protein
MKEKKEFLAVITISLLILSIIIGITPAKLTGSPIVANVDGGVSEGKKLQQHLSFLQNWKKN